GYAVRSHHILTALQQSGVQVQALTRIGYPLVIGRWVNDPVDVVDGIEYHRVLPKRTPGLLDARLRMQAELLTQSAAEFGAHIIHTTTPYDNALMAEAAARALGVPWVYETRGEMESTWLASRPEWAQEHAA